MDLFKKLNETVITRIKEFLTILYDLFRSLKLTIFLFILLAILSIFGTLITQNATRLEYIQRYGLGLYEVLNFFNLFDMYHSWWFSAILSLLVINLITCSLHRFPGVWRQISHGPSTGGLEDSMLKALPYVEKIRVPSQAVTKANPEEEIQSYLKKWFRNPRRMETESTITLYSEKGRFSRLGVYVTHLSLLIILIGGIIGSLYGFRGHVEILEGETVNQIFLRMKDQEVPKPIDFSVRCDDFDITYYDLKRPEKHVKEYTSVLTILENEKEVLKKTVQVNHPLHYKGLAFYQSNYGAIHDVTLGIQWRGKKEKATFHVLEGSTGQIPNTNALIRLLKFEHQVHNFGEGVQVVLFKPNQEPRPFWLLRNFPKFDEQRGDEFVLTVEGLTEKEYTGLQVTKDPGVWVVWIGCSLMIFGLIVSFFFSHQRVWVRIPRGPRGEIVLAGSANKNRVGFEKNFGLLVEGVRSISQ
jgi:cytochrome c biogenesis protein